MRYNNSSYDIKDMQEVLVNVTGLLHEAEVELDGIIEFRDIAEDIKAARQTVSKRYDEMIDILIKYYISEILK